MAAVIGALALASAAGGCPSTAPGLAKFSPANNSDAVVKTGTRAVWSAAGPVALRTLTIESGAELILPETTATSIAVSVVSVRGALTVGSVECPIVNGSVLITLTDTAEVSVPTLVPPTTTKAVIVWPGGRLDVHGQPARASWTRLSKTARSGSSVVCVDSAAHGWRAGDRLVLAPSGFAGGAAERGDIESVEGSCLTLRSPLKYDKYGAAVTKELNTEVGLLTRNVVIEGDTSSLTGACPVMPFGSAPPQLSVWRSSCFGGHTMYLHNTTVRLSGVEMRGMGQANVLGRYPVHWHMAGPAAGSFVKDSAVHSGFQRCVTVHGSFDVVVSGVVCSDTRGHGFFLEDAVEYGNSFTGNFAVNISAGPMLCSDNSLGLEQGGPVPTTAPHDAGPSGFWISNPNNTFDGNVAAAVGGALHGFGFWIAVPQSPLEPSVSFLAKLPNVPGWVTKQQPLQVPLRSFRNNVAHSNYQGFQMDGLPKGSNATDGLTCAAQGTGQYRGVAVLERPIAWKNFRGLWLHGSNVRVHNAVTVDNGAGMTIENIDDGPGANPKERVVSDSVFVGETDNQYAGALKEHPMCVHQNPQPIGKSCTQYKPRGFEILNGGLCLKNSSFSNFSDSASFVTHWNPTTYCPDSDPYYPSPSFIGQASGQGPSAGPFFLLNNQSVTIDGRMLDLSETSGARNIVVYRPNDTALVAESGHLVDPSTCEYRAEWGSYECRDTWYNTFQVVFDGVAGPVNWTWWQSENPSWPSRWTRRIGAVDTRFSQPQGACSMGTVAGLEDALKSRAPGVPVLLHLQAWNTLQEAQIRGSLYLTPTVSVRKCTVYSTTGPPAACASGGDPWASTAAAAALESGNLVWSMPGTATGLDLELVFSKADEAADVPKPFSRKCPSLPSGLHPGWSGRFCAGV